MGRGQYRKLREALGRGGGLYERSVVTIATSLKKWRPTIRDLARNTGYRSNTNPITTTVPAYSENRPPPKTAQGATMKKIFWAADLGSANRAKRSSITGRSETFTGVDTLDGQSKRFVGVVSSVEDMGKNALDGRQWRVSIEVAD
jgi:hypothetical protein